MRRWSLLVLLPAFCGLSLGCGSETPPPPLDAPETRAAIEEEDAAVHDAESHADEQTRED